jgi:hypothetical protein
VPFRSGRTVCIITKGFLKCIFLDYKEDFLNLLKNPLQEEERHPERKNEVQERMMSK